MSPSNSSAAPDQQFCAQCGKPLVYTRTPQGRILARCTNCGSTLIVLPRDAQDPGAVNAPEPETDRSASPDRPSPVTTPLPSRDPRRAGPEPNVRTRPV